MHTKSDTSDPAVPNDLTFGHWLHQRRRLLDLTQSAFASQVGCARITLSRIEADTLMPSKQLAAIILEKVGIPFAEREDWLRFARGLSGMPKSAPPSSPGRHPRTNLPALLTSFIGREREQTQVIELLRQHRLITLTGAGGVGKTRLSLRIGKEVLQDFADGIWLAELASLSDPGLVAGTIAAALGLDAPQGILPVEPLINYLREKTLLLIVDNCEHLLDACAQLADTLLKSCPDLRILATSREALGILGEVVYRVPSLGFPDVLRLLEEFKAFESARLFEERAQLADPGFELTIENAGSVAAICSRLDGIPLAVELAAARVNVLSVQEIAERLDQCFDLLTGGNRTALPRQQTIRASIDWSWNLLSNAERVLLRRLSVFAGGWTDEAVEAVCGGEGFDAQGLTELIRQLVSKSLVVISPPSKATRRYHLLETIRQYAQEQLVACGEETAVRTRHLQYFLQLSRQAQAAWIGPGQVTWYAHMDEERDNVRAALAWALQVDCLEEGMLLYSSLNNLWLAWGILEAIRWGRAFLDKPRSREYSRARSWALYISGMFLSAAEQFGDAYAVADECLACARAGDDVQAQVNALLLEAWVRLDSGKRDQVLSFAQQGLDLARSIGDKWGQARSLSLLGWGERDHTQIRAYWNEAEALTRQLGNWFGLAEHLSDFGNFELLDGNVEFAKHKLQEAFALNRQLNNRRRMEKANQAYGRIALMEGDLEEARTRFQANLVTARERGSRGRYLWSSCWLGHVEIRQGHLASARDTWADCLRGFEKEGLLEGMVFTIESMAGFLTAIGKMPLAARLMGWANKARSESELPRPVIEQREIDGIMSRLVAALGAEACTHASEAGKCMALEEAVACALANSAIATALGRSIEQEP